MITKQLRNKLYGYLTKKLGMYDYTRGWLKGNCPSCGKSDKFGIHLGMYRSNCFVCGYHERPLHVVAHIEDINISQVLVMLKAFEGLEYIEPPVKELEQVTVELPLGFRLLGQGDDTVATAIRNYIKNKRGLDPSTLAHKGFGYCIDGPLFGYLIAPYYNNGKLVYYQGRRVLGSGAKFENPNVEDIGRGKTTLIYNQDALYYYEHVYAVESVFNAETVGDNGISFGGKKLSNWQISAIVSSPIERVTIILDPDAYREALELAMQLVQFKRVKVILLPDDQDVNSYGRHDTMLKVWRNRFLTYNDLLKLKHNAERSEYSHI